jgi:hypothetical protein
VASIPDKHPIDRHQRPLPRQTNDELPVLGKEFPVEPADSFVCIATYQQAAGRVHEIGEEEMLEPHVGCAVSRDEASAAEVLTPAHVPWKVAGVEHPAIAIDIFREDERASRVGPTADGIHQGFECLVVPQIVRI